MQALVYAGSPIGERDELLCLTDMWKAAGSPENKRPVDWLRSADAQGFISFLAESLNVGISHLAISEKGGRSPSTWAHWQVGMAYAKSLLPEFHAWCNEVVRAHMEGRQHAPQTSTAVTDSALILAVREIVAPLAIRFDHQDQTIGKVEAKVEGIAQDVASIKFRLDHRRRNLTAETKREHVSAVQVLGGRCPCCGTAPVVDESGAKAPFAEFDHFYQNSKPDPDHTWLICQPCHTKLTTGRVPRDKRNARFEAYQDKRRELPGRQAKLFD